MESTSITKEQKREVAQKLYTELRDIIIGTSMNFLQMGRLLKIIREEKLYLYLGDGGYDSFRMFISDADLGIKHATAYAFIRLYEVYIMKLGYQQKELVDIPWARLQMLSGIVEPQTRALAEPWVAKARALSNSDFQMEIREKKANEKETTYVPFPHMFRCKECSRWVVDVTDENLCQGH
jgi:hypothetical protein